MNRKLAWLTVPSMAFIALALLIIVASCTREQPAADCGAVGQPPCLAGAGLTPAGAGLTTEPPLAGAGLTTEPPPAGAGLLTEPPEPQQEPLATPYEAMADTTNFNNVWLRGKLDTEGDANVGGALNVVGTTTLMGDRAFDTLLDVQAGMYDSTGTLTLYDATQITGTLDLLGALADSGGNLALADDVDIGGGYGSTGCTVSAAGVLQCNGAATTDGALTAASATLGGGYGSTGCTVSSAGVLQCNGAATTDGTMTAADEAIGGGYGSTGCTTTSAGVLSCDGNVTTAGTVTVGSTGVTLSKNGTAARVAAAGGLEVYAGAIKLWSIAPGSAANLTAGQGSGISGSVGATVGGGLTNTVTSANYATISGGTANTASGTACFVGGGDTQDCQADYATLVGGWHNTAGITATYGFIGGGKSNQANGDSSAVLGGASGTADGQYALVVGGNTNQAAGILSVAMGGSANQANGEGSLVLGGTSNTATGIDSTVINGTENAMMGNGQDNAGDYAIIAGGHSNDITANGDYGFAAGRRAHVNHQGSFVWGDSTDADFTSVTTNTFNVRATGGTYFDSGDVTVNPIPDGGNARVKNELIALPRIKLVGLGGGTNGAAGGKTLRLEDDTPVGEFAASDADVVCTTDATYYREGAASLKLAFASAADDGDGCHDAVVGMDFSSDESVGFFLSASTTLASDDLQLELTDDGGVRVCTIPVVATANAWQWVDLTTCITALSDAEKNSISDVSFELSAAGATKALAGAFNVYVDAVYKWDSTEEDALGVAVLRDGVTSIVNAAAGTSLVEYTDYFVHEESGSDFVVWVTDQSAAFLIALAAY